MLSDSAIILLRTFILAIGWPVLIAGSAVLVVLGTRFYRLTKGTIFGKLVFPTVLGWLVTMYILGVTATFYMFDVPRRGTLVVLPIFLIWFVTFVTLAKITRRWSLEAVRLRDFYVKLEEEVWRRTSELAGVNRKYGEQIRELDRMSKLLIRRDFERQQVTERLREIDEAKTSFVSIAAHQLRTPLSAIKWTFHMLSSGDLGKLKPDQAEIIVQAAESTDRLIALIGDLLNVARIESGQIVYTFGSFAIEKMVSRVGEEARPKAEEKGLKFEIDLPSTPLSQANGDQEKLSMAIQNIVENAINYTPKDGAVRVFLKHLDQDHYRIIVSDTGIGVPLHQKQRLFEKFFRADNVLRRDISGTGLGLYVAKRIIEAHGGTIEVESEEGKGSDFIVTLPYLK